MKYWTQYQEGNQTIYVYDPPGSVGAYIIKYANSRGYSSYTVDGNNEEVVVSGIESSLLRVMLGTQAAVAKINSAKKTKKKGNK